ncbi:hypothetical protein QCA50_013626 [Cerrena zonata]|uniref:Uncharacterized protein n=1 Tax=Cerrena zonata TaxID=2478898 RepID=A0AAW0FYV0_9APHY
MPSRATREKKRQYQRDYYARNKTARREYQIQYNRVRRATRCKLSKKDLETMRQRKRNETDGTTRVFENSICRRSGERDPEYTKEMANDEKLLLDDLTQLRVHMSNEYLREHRDADDDGWIPTYTKQVEVQLQVEACWGLRMPELHREGKVPKEDIHALRRRVAILHQERGSIVCGYGVNKTEFRRLYGF